MQRIAAFTIIELVVVMLLTGLIAGFSWFCMGVVSEAYHSFKQSGEFAETVTFFSARIKTDVASAHHTLYAGDGFACHFDDGRVVTYKVSYDALIREQEGRRDTLRAKDFSARHYYNGTEQAVHGQPVDRLSVAFTYHEQEYTLTGEKVYGADFLMEMEQTTGL